MAAAVLLLAVLIAASAVAFNVSTPQPNSIVPHPSSRTVKADHRERVIKRRVVRVEPHPAPPIDHVIFQDLGKHYCIGGGDACSEYCEEPAKNCESKGTFMVKFERPTRISRIQLYASDEGGLTREAELAVKLDGRDIGTVAVVWSGGAVDVPVQRKGRLLTIAARDRSSEHFAGETALISEIHVFGHDLP